MAFIDIRLPEEVELGAARHDVEDVEIVTTDGGYETRNVRASQSLLEFDVQYPTSGRDASIYSAVRSLYKAARGKLHSFRFKDWSDYQLTLEQIGTGDGSAVAFQITKTYTSASTSHVRVITRPVSPVSVYVNDVLKTVTTDYSVAYGTGIITFVTAPTTGHTVKVTGEFDVPVRFDSDMSLTGIATHLDHIDSLSLKEVRE